MHAVREKKLSPDTCVAVLVIVQSSDKSCTY